MNQQLIFVYNVNSDLFSTITDFAHKIFSPATYQCQLCALMYGKFSILHEWKVFIKSLPVKTVFLHRNEFESQYKIKPVLPAIFISEDDEIEELITKQEIDDCRSLNELKNLVTEKLNQHVKHHHSNI